MRKVILAPAAAIAIAAITATPTFAAATLEPRTTLIVGPGGQTCADYNKERNEAYYGRSKYTLAQIDELYVIWAEGYMSSYNGFRIAAGKDARDLVSLTTHVGNAVMVEYCRKHPEQTYMDAIVSLYESLPEVPGSAAALRSSR